jgi:hypothetical protein
LTAVGALTVVIAEVKIATAALRSDELRVDEREPTA